MAWQMKTIKQIKLGVLVARLCTRQKELESQIYWYKYKFKIKRWEKDQHHRRKNANHRNQTIEGNKRNKNTEMKRMLSVILIVIKIKRVRQRIFLLIIYKHLKMNTMVLIRARECLFILSNNHKRDFKTILEMMEHLIIVLVAPFNLIVRDKLEIVKINSEMIQEFQLMNIIREVWIKIKVGHRFRDLWKVIQ